MSSWLRKVSATIVAIIVSLLLSIAISYGQSVNYFYDDSNRLIRVEYPDGTVIGYSYDAVGNRVEEALVPPTGTPVSVSGPITTATPTYVWDAAFGATMYCIKVNDSTGTKIEQCYTPAQAGCPDGTGTCSVTPAVELAGGAGQWWIRIYDPAGYGPWSAAMDFSVNPPPAATLVSPNGTIGTDHPTYTWNAVSGSSSYYLTVNDSGGVRIQQWYTAGDAGCPSGTGTCAVTPSIHLAGGAGQWWIQTYNTAGNGPLSSGMNFSVNLPPATGVDDSYTKSLLHFDGSNNASVFTDESGKVWTRTAWPVINTDKYKLGGASGAFNSGGGNGNYISTPINSDFSVSTGDYTIDFWVFWPSTPYFSAFFQAGASNQGFIFYYHSANQQLILYHTAAYHSWSWTPAANTWYHLAVVRYQGAVNVYVNGSQIGTTWTGSNAALAVNPSGASVYLGHYTIGTADHKGYLDEFRFSNGIARWTSNFTPSSVEYRAPSNPNLGGATLVSPTGDINNPSPVTYTWNAVSGSTSYYLKVNDSAGVKIQQWYTSADAGCPDGTGTCSITTSDQLAGGSGQWWVQTYNSSGTGPFSEGMNFNVITTSPDQYTKVLLHFNGDNGSTTFTDETGRSWTRTGAPVISTAQSEFGGASGAFNIDNGNGKYISTPASADFNVGTGDFTIDFWVRWPNTPTYSAIFQAGAYGSGIILWWGANSFAMYYGYGYGTWSFTPSVNTWYHIACVSFQQRIHLYVNGVEIGSPWSTSGSCPCNGAGAYIGHYTIGTADHKGYIDELRFSVGIARWTANFTPPVAEYYP